MRKNVFALLLALLAVGALGASSSALAQSRTLNGCRIGPGALCPDIRLSGANLRNTDLTGSLMSGVQLNSADLSGAKMTDINFKKACSGPTPG